MCKFKIPALVLSGSGSTGVLSALHWCKAPRVEIKELSKYNLKIGLIQSEIGVKPGPLF